MSIIVPSYIAKLARAKRHLIDLESEVQRYADTHPYTVRETVEGKKRKVRRICFTGSPANTDIPLITADAIYNLRSALDHLMSALVENKDRNSVLFPIFFQGVWEPAAPDENTERAKWRSRWASDTKTARDVAVAGLKQFQPPDDPRQQDEPDTLALLTRLSNRDRYERLPVVASGLKSIRIQFDQQAGVATAESAWCTPTTFSTIRQN